MSTIMILAMSFEVKTAICVPVVVGGGLLFTIWKDKRDSRKKKIK